MANCHLFLVDFDLNFFFFVILYFLDRMSFRYGWKIGFLDKNRDINYKTVIASPVLGIFKS